MKWKRWSFNTQNKNTCRQAFLFNLLWYLNAEPKTALCTDLYTTIHLLSIGAFCSVKSPHLMKYRSTINHILQNCYLKVKTYWKLVTAKQNQNLHVCWEGKTSKYHCFYKFECILCVLIKKNILQKYYFKSLLESCSYFRNAAYSKLLHLLCQTYWMKHTLLSEYLVSPLCCNCSTSALSELYFLAAYQNKQYT